MYYFTWCVILYSAVLVALHFGVFPIKMYLVVVNLVIWYICVLL